MVPFLEIKNINPTNGHRTVALFLVIILSIFKQACFYSVTTPVRNKSLSLGSKVSQNLTFHFNLIFFLSNSENQYTQACNWLTMVSQCI